jgi:hypothetical protein
MKPCLFIRFRDRRRKAVAYRWTGQIGRIYFTSRQSRLQSAFVSDSLNSRSCAFSFSSCPVETAVRDCVPFSILLFCGHGGLALLLTGLSVAVVIVYVALR